MKEKCQHYRKAEGFIEIEETKSFVCTLPNLDSDKAKLKVQCQGDVNQCENFPEFMVCSKIGM